MKSPCLSFLAFHTPPSSPPTTSRSSLQDITTNSSSSIPSSTSIITHNHIKNSSSDDSDDSNKQTREPVRKLSKIIAKWSLGTSLLIFIIYYWRKKWQQQQPQKHNTSNNATGSTSSTIRGLVMSLFLKSRQKTEILAPLSYLLHAAKHGHITKALLNASSCVFYKSSSLDNSCYRVTLPFQSSTFQTELLNMLTEGGCNDIGALPESWITVLATPAIMAMPFVYLLLLYKMMNRLHQNHNDSNLLSNKRNNNNNNSESTIRRTTFNDVAGVDMAKLELMEVVQCLRAPQRYRSIGARPPRGVLLYGPTGTGKTLLARAVAGEANCSCFLSCSASDFVEMLVGRGAARIRALFDKAKKEALLHHAAAPNTRQRRTTTTRARNGLQALLPCNLFDTTTRTTTISQDNVDMQQQPSAIIFIDEIDALAKSRTGGLHGNDEREQTLNQLLTEMDGFDEQSEVIIIVLAATNRPEILDSALLRPGRFDRHVHVGCPDARGREDMLRLHTKNVRLDLHTVDLERLAAYPTTNGFSGADVRNVVNEAAFLAIREGRESVGQHHLIQAADKVAKLKYHI